MIATPRGAAGRTAVVLVMAAVPLAILGALFVLPVAGMVNRGLDGGLGPVLDVFGRPRIHRVLWFTVWSSALASAISVLGGVPVAAVLYRLDWPGRPLVRAVVLAPFVMPTVVIAIAFRQLLSEGGLLGGLGLDQSAAAIIAGLVFFNLPMVVRAVGLAWEGLDPEPAEAATVLGAGAWTVWRRITLPALRPAIAGSASVAFLFCATAFGIVLILGGLRYSSVETEIYLQTTTLLDLRAASALSILQMIAVVLLLGFTARVGRTVPSEHGVVRPRPIARYDLPAIGLTLLVLVFLLTPLVTLVVGSLRRDGAWTLVNYRDLEGVLGPAIAASLQTALVATSIALVLGLLVAFIASGRSTSTAEAGVRRLVDGAFMLPLGVSAVTLGFGFLLTLGQWRTSPWLVPIAQALVALPLVVRIVAPVWAAVDQTQRDAAATLGASPARIVRRVDLPAIRPAATSAAALAAAVSLGEFGATSFLAREDHLTLPIVIYRLVTHPGAANLGAALAASVVLAALAGAVLLAGELAGRGR